MLSSTKQKWYTLPQIILTANVDGDLSYLDFELEETKEWFNAMENSPSLATYPLFDELKGYRNNVKYFKPC